MKNICITLRRCLTLFLVWMLTQLGPVQEFRVLSGGIMASAQAKEGPERKASDISDRLPDCAAYKAKGGEAPKGNKCKIDATSFDDNDEGWMISEGYVSILLTWSVAMIFMYQVLRCRMPKVSCGYSTIFSSIGAIALFAGEIAAVVGYALSIGKIKEKVEYRRDQVEKQQDQCAAGAIGSGSGSGSIGDISACDQMDYLKAQQEALGSAKTASTWKFGLAIAAAVCFGIAAVIELAGWIAGNTQDSLNFALGSTSIAGIEAAEQAACNTPLIPPVVVGGAALSAACHTACKACQAGAAASQVELTAILTYQNEVVTPEISNAACTAKYILTRTRQMAETEAACLAAKAVPLSQGCYAATVAYTTALRAALVQANCPNQNACILGCAWVGTLIVKNSPENYYDSNRRTCGLEQNNILQLPSGQRQQGYGELSLNHYLNVTKLPDIFFKHDSSFYSFLLNEEEVQRETAQAQTEINLRDQQEQFSLNDYRKVRQFYGEDLMADNQFDFLKIFLPSAIAETKTDDKNENSSMPVNQVIGHSLALAAFAIPVFIGLLKAADMAADNAFSTPARRTGWNTLAAGLASAQAIYIKYKVIDKLDKEINDIQSILDLKAGASTTVSTGDSTTIPYNEVSVDSTFFEPPPPLPGNQTYPCAAGGDGKGGCKDVGNAMDSTLGSLDLSSLAGLAGSLKTLNNGIGGKKTMSTGTMSAATTLANAARGVKKKIGDLQSKINKSRAEKNQAPIDFAGIQRKSLKSLFKNANAYLASKGMTAASMMPNSPITPTSDKDLEKKLAEDLANKGAAAPAAAAPAAGNGIGDLTFENPAAEGGAGLEAGAETTPVKELDDSFQVPNNDIGSDANADIFQMLSSRYLKSAYPVFFEEEKAPAPAKAP